MTAPVSSKRSAEEAIIEWFQGNVITVAIGLVVVLIAFGGYWFYNRSVELKNQNAEVALTTALRSVSAGNTALAQSDLQKAVDQYGDTQPGIEAGLLLAEMDFNGGKFDDGVGVLQKLLGSSASSLDAATIYSLMGDGQLQANHAPAAAKSYVSAADAAKSDADRAYQQSKAARAYLVAGDTANARQLWQKLADDPKAQGVASEARVRLGELEAKPASKG